MGGKVQIWESLSGMPVAGWEAHNSKVTSLAFDATGRYVASGGSGPYDCSVVVWDLNALLYPVDGQAIAIDREIFDEKWKMLGDEDPVPAYSAMSVLANNKSTTVRFLDIKMDADVGEGRKQRIADLITQLNSPSFAQRQSAQAELVSLRAGAERQLNDALESPASPEVEMRIREIISHKIEQITLPRDEYVRQHRAIALLELIGTEAAKERLDLIAHGHTNIEIARHASAVLRRME